MKPQHLLLSAPLTFLGAAQAFSSSGTSTTTSFVTRSTSSSLSSFRMDMETGIDASVTKSIEKKLAEANLSINRHLVSNDETSMSMEDAEATHGMPWSDTIGISNEENPLLYMPFWEWQMEHMKESLTNLRPDECAMSEFGYNENLDKKARIINQCYTCDEYRKIRMTYYDAGDNTQVFNSVWYPDPKYNLPVLGIDLLAFNRKKYLAIVDFQPLYEDEEDHATTFEHRMKPIKDQYESLKGRMSSKFYDETKFFSQEMLFARFDKENVVTKDLFPAFKRYVNLHNKILRDTTEEESKEAQRQVMKRQQAYDTYSAERDPATGLFATMFGKEWANDFVFDFLFSLSENKEQGLQIPPMFGGGGPPPQGGAAGGPPAQHQPKQERVMSN